MTTTNQLILGKGTNNQSTSGMGVDGDDVLYIATPEGLVGVDSDGVETSIGGGGSGELSRYVIRITQSGTAKPEMFWMVNPDDGLVFNAGSNLGNRQKAGAYSFAFNSTYEADIIFASTAYSQEPTGEPACIVGVGVERYADQLTISIATFVDNAGALDQTADNIDGMLIYIDYWKQAPVA